MNRNDKLRWNSNWRDSGFDSNMSRSNTQLPTPTDYIGGADFEAKLDDLVFNRMIKLKDLRQVPQGNEPGKIYWDGDNKKYKMWVDRTGKWVDVLYTSTSTSTSLSTSSTSSSTSSTSTSSTSRSTSSTSTSVT
jgi:hypothetical protein